MRLPTACSAFFEALQCRGSLIRGAEAAPAPLRLLLLAPLMAEEPARPLRVSAALNTTRADGSTTTAAPPSKQPGPGDGLQEQLRDAFRLKREAAQAERSARNRERRLEAASSRWAVRKVATDCALSQAGTPHVQPRPNPLPLAPSPPRPCRETAAELSSSFDPAGRGGAAAAAPARRAASSSHRAGSVGSVPPRPAAPAHSTLSTDGSRPGGERLSIGSRPAARAEEARARAPEPAARQQVTQQQSQPEAASSGAAERPEQAAMHLPPGPAGSSQAQAGPAPGSCLPAARSSSSSQAARRSSTPAASSGAYSNAADPRAPPAVPGRVAAAAGNRPAPVKQLQQQQQPGGKRQRVLGAAHHISQPAVPTSFPARPAAGRPSGSSAPAAGAAPAQVAHEGGREAGAEERASQLAVEYGSRLVLKLINCHLDAMLAGPAHEVGPGQEGCTRGREGVGCAAVWAVMGTHCDLGAAVYSAFQ